MNDADLTRLIAEVSERIAEMERATELILRPLKAQLAELKLMESERLVARRARLIEQIEQSPFLDSAGYD